MTHSLSSQDIEQLEAFSRATLKDALDYNDELDNEALYHSLPLCIVDAVFSISARYESTTKVVERLANKQQWLINSTEGQEEPSIQALLDLYKIHGIQGMADTVYENRQRTSVKNGILKSEAVFLFAKALDKAGVKRLADISKENYDAIKKEVIKIPGQRSGISLRYFYMLTGDYDHVKPDRFVMRFAKMGLNGRSLSVEECHEAIVRTCLRLQSTYPELTPRAFDKRIWRWGRDPKNN